MQSTQTAPTLPQQRTPLPLRRIIVLGLILAANNCSIWMIFSYLPYMVHDFYPALSMKALGNKAGFLGSAFSAGSLVGNFMWGIAADRVGRRPVLLCGLVGTAVSAILFGFSGNFYMAVFSRFLWGLLNGNIGVSKTYMGEILDDSNIARGMAIFGVFGGVGRTVGALLGGFLSSPAKSLPHVFGGTIFETFPYSLPSLVVCVFCVAIITLGYFELPETLVFRKGGVFNSSSSSSSNNGISDRGDGGVDSRISGGRKGVGIMGDFGMSGEMGGGKRLQYSQVSTVEDPTEITVVGDKETSILHSNQYESDNATSASLRGEGGGQDASGIEMTVKFTSQEEGRRSNRNDDSCQSPDDGGSGGGKFSSRYDNANDSPEYDKKDGLLMMSSSPVSPAEMDIHFNQFSGVADDPASHILRLSNGGSISNSISSSSSINNPSAGLGLLRRRDPAAGLATNSLYSPAPTKKYVGGGGGGGYDSNSSTPKKKSVSFSSLVVIKVIGSNALAYSQLKRLSKDDKPLMMIDDDDNNTDADYNADVGFDAGVGVDIDVHGVGSRYVGGRRGNGMIDNDNDRDDMNGDDMSGVGMLGRRDSNGGSGSNNGSGGDSSIQNGQIEYSTIPMESDDEEAALKGGINHNYNNNNISNMMDGRGHLKQLRYSNGAEFTDTVDAFFYKSTFMQVSYLLSKREILLSTALYGLNGFVQLVTNEIFPLWVVTSKEEGGFGFDASNIGIVTMIAGPVSVVCQIWLYPALVDCYGVLKVYHIGATTFALTLFLMPGISIIGKLDNPTLTWFALVTSLCITSVTSMWVLISVFVLINNSCYSHQRATVNGIGQTFAALGRLVGPYLGGILFAWSETNGLGWPCNYALAFYLTGALSMFNANLSKFFPRSIHRRKREPVNPRYTPLFEQERDD